MSDSKAPRHSSLCPLVRDDAAQPSPSVEMDWDSDEPTLTTGLSALLAERMRAGSNERIVARVGEDESESRSPTFYHSGMAAIWGVLAGLTSAWAFALPEDANSPSGADAVTPRQIHIVEVQPEGVDTPEATMEFRASHGDAEAIEILLSRGRSMTSAQILAVFEGRIASEAKGLEALGDTPSKLLQASEGVRPRIRELDALSRLPGASAADALHEIWSRSLRTSDPATETQQLAHRLLVAPDVRSRASSSLEAALALYDARDCESARAAMTKAEALGDRRSAHGIQQIAGGSACDEGDGECQRCVQHRSLTHRAFLAVKDRPACLSWVCPSGDNHSPPTLASKNEPTAFALATKEPHD